MSVFNIDQALADMDGGVLMAKLAQAVQDTALGTINHGDKGKKGKVTLELTFERIGDSHQVMVGHTVVFQCPTRRGKASETDATETPFYVNRSGHLSISPVNGDIFTPSNLKETA